VKLGHRAANVRQTFCSLLFSSIVLSLRLCTRSESSKPLHPGINASAGKFEVNYNKISEPRKIDAAFVRVREMEHAMFG
jgi:hypothetical protein